MLSSFPVVSMCLWMLQPVTQHDKQGRRKLLRSKGVISVVGFISGCGHVPVDVAASHAARQTGPFFFEKIGFC